MYHLILIYETHCFKMRGVNKLLDINGISGIRGVIFDLDGTLIDSMWMWEEIDKKFLIKRGIKWERCIHGKQIEGMSFTETAIYFKNTFKLEESIDEIKDEWLSMTYDAYKNQVPLKKGVLHFLKYLKEREIPTAIATSNSIDLVNVILQKHSIEYLFNTVITSCEVKKGKPSPDVFLKAAERIGVDSANCIVFEDTVAGVNGAKNAGMNVIAIEDESSTDYAEELRELADLYIKNFEELQLQ